VKKGDDWVIKPERLNDIIRFFKWNMVVSCRKDEEHFQMSVGSLAKSIKISFTTPYVKKS
jgi:hypothetical protein